jgi:DNA-binding response OmpR family regulator
MSANAVTDAQADAAEVHRLMRIVDDMALKPFSETAPSLGMKAFDALQQEIAQKDAVIAELTTALFMGDAIRERLQLRRSEYTLFLLLTSRSPAFVKREAIKRHICRFETDSKTNAVDVAVSRLRQKLSVHGIEITTVRNFGYALDVENMRRFSALRREMMR